MTHWIVSALITPRRGILDPQGKAVEGALHSLGFEGVREVHVGRYIIIECDAGDESGARSAVTAMCEKLLANPVIEDFEIATAREA